MTPTESRATRGGTDYRACSGVGGRGCSCPFHARRRVYARNYVRRKHAAKLARRRMSATTCPRRFGKYGVCGGLLVSDTLNGRLVVSCPRCERFERGICRDCPRPVDGTPRKARFCATHRRTANATYYANYRDRDREMVNARARRAYQKDDAVRERRNEYKRQWRKANRDKVRAQKRRYAERHPDTIRAYHDEYNAAHRVKLANRQRARYHGAVPLRTCITPRCSTVLTGRKKKCTKCQQREAQQAAALLALRQGRGRRTDKERAA